jgi:hypothetical protein
MGDTAATDTQTIPIIPIAIPTAAQNAARARESSTGERAILESAPQVTLPLFLWRLFLWIMTAKLHELGEVSICPS